MSYYDEEATQLPHAEECHEMESLSSTEDSHFSHDECHNEDHESGEDVYFHSLKKLLCHTSTPVTVGFCSSYKARVQTLLEQIKKSVHEESIQKEEKEFRRTRERSRVPKGINYLVLFWHIIFCQPVITKKHLERRNFKFMFIQFSAWEYACSDQLWAGLITTLCDHIRNHFGPLPLSFYQAVGSNPELVLQATQDWRLKKKTCYIAVALLVIVAGLAPTALLVPEIRDGTFFKYLSSIIGAILGSGFFIAISPVIKNLIITQKKKIESMTSDEKFTKHLGFRSAVKREFEVLTNFIRHMEIFERRHLKIVFEITSLDICYPDQVVGVLNAIHTLLSNKNSPFIFILVVDPCIIVSCLEKADSMKGMADNGYLYLNRIMTLPFSIPEIAIMSKMQSLQETLKSLEVLMHGTSRKNLEMTKGLESQQQMNDRASQYINTAFQCLKDEKDPLYHYVPNNIIQMRRIGNTIPIMIRLMTQQHLLRDNLCPRDVAGWVVLANSWPCRLSWILQCVEDKMQCKPPKGYGKKLMLDVFKETRSEPFFKQKELQNIIALDGDPELFENFLSLDFPFTVEEANKFLKFTVNLDHSIKCKMGQLLALATLEKKSSKGLPVPGNQVESPVCFISFWQAPTCLGNPVDGPPTPELMSYSDEEAAQLPHAEERHETGSLSSNKDSHINHCGRPNEDLLSEDEIYCSCLLKTLCHTSTPVTVGFYSSHKACIHTLLDHIAGCMLKESIRGEEEEFDRTHQRSRVPEGINYLTLLWHIIFYQPVITKKHLERIPIEFIIINFSAWEYACSNQLWAGLVTTLCDHIRNHFGSLPLSLYHAVGSNPELVLQATQEWRLKKKTCCMAVGVLVIVFLTVAGLTTTSLLVPEIRNGTFLKYLGSSIAAILGSGLFIAISPVIKNLIISQKKKIETMTSDEKLTSHLGFRTAVKREMEVLTNFIRYMEIFERRHLKIVFNITCLDICYPEQVFGVLNAINTLLSDTNAPFIFILVIDPCVIVPCLEKASSTKEMTDNGYLYLNRTVTLPFSIPEIAIKSKMHCLQKTFLIRKDLMYKDMGHHEAQMEKEATVDKDPPQTDKSAYGFIHAAFECLKNEQDCLYHYVPDSIIQMRRIINTIPITIRLMTQKLLVEDSHCARRVAGWVVLANQWPCRLSWILQCIEDKLKYQPPKDYEKRLMWDVFMETCPELYSKHKELRNILALDGDPKLFERFLSSDFRFTVEEGKKFLKYTVNLDHSIRCMMKKLQGLAILENYSKGGANSEKRD